MSISKLYYINVATNATFKPTGNYSTNLQDLENLFKHLKEKDTKKLVIHIHGGLNNEATGMEIASRMAVNMSAVEAHNVSFVWESGLIETLKDNWRDIGLDSGLFQKIVNFVFRKLTKKLGVELGAKNGHQYDFSYEQAELKLSKILVGEEGDIDEQSNIEISLDEFSKELTNIEFTAMEDSITQEVNSELAANNELRKEIDTAISMEQSNTERAKGLSGLSFAIAIGKIVYNVVMRYRKNTAHGFHATIIEETLRYLGLATIGESVWKAMKNKTKLMWEDNPASNSDLEKRPGYEFLVRLNELMSNNPQLKLDVVGHSAGAVAISYLLKNINTPAYGNIKIRNIALLAPAVTMDLFEEGVIKNSQKFESLYIYTMKDELERRDTLVDKLSFLYPSSLLYFISGVLEDEVDKSLIGMHRFFKDHVPGSNSNVEDRCAEFINSSPKTKLALSKTIGIEGLETESLDHGMFDNDSKTLKSLRFIVNQ